MAYITISNSKKLIAKVDELTLNTITEPFYKKDINFFNKRESASLKGIRELFRNLETFQLTYYKPVIVEDSYRYVIPEKQPSYHHDDTCERLKSSFINTEVPNCVRQKGPDEVVRFRSWFTTCEFSDRDDYIKKVQLQFPYVKPKEPQEVVLKNSGSVSQKNWNVADLEREIDNLLSDAERYFHSNSIVRDILAKYQKLTCIAYTTGKLANNNSGISDDDLKSFLKAFDQKYKNPIKERLILYYQMKFNPELIFEGSLLEKMNFTPCGACLN